MTVHVFKKNIYILHHFGFSIILIFRLSGCIKSTTTTDYWPEYNSYNLSVQGIANVYYNKISKRNLSLSDAAA